MTSCAFARSSAALAASTSALPRPRRCPFTPRCARVDGAMVAVVVVAVVNGGGGELLTARTRSIKSPPLGTEKKRGEGVAVGAPSRRWLYSTNRLTPSPLLPCEEPTASVRGATGAPILHPSVTRHLDTQHSALSTEPTVWPVTGTHHPPPPLPPTARPRATEKGGGRGGKGWDGRRGRGRAATFVRGRGQVGE